MRRFPCLWGALALCAPGVLRGNSGSLPLQQARGRASSRFQSRGKKTSPFRALMFSVTRSSTQQPRKLEETPGLSGRGVPGRRWDLGFCCEVWRQCLRRGTDTGLVAAAHVGTEGARVTTHSPLHVLARALSPNAPLCPKSSPSLSGAGGWPLPA